MRPDRPTAILFDLWGTLVPPRSDRRDAVSRLMAADLGVDAIRFAAAIRSSHGERFAGRTGSLGETLRALAKRCGGDPDASALDRAVARRLELTRELLAADPETLAVLDALRDAGLRLGLVSDASIETVCASLIPSSTSTSQASSMWRRGSARTSVTATAASCPAPWPSAWSRCGCAGTTTSPIATTTTAASPVPRSLGCAICRRRRC